LGNLLPTNPQAARYLEAVRDWERYWARECRATSLFDGSGVRYKTALRGLYEMQGNCHHSFVNDDTGFTSWGFAGPHLFDPKYCTKCGCYKMSPTAWDILMSFNKLVGGFHSIERSPAKASKSEMRRWFRNKAVIMNGKAVSSDDEIESLESLVLFPKGRRRTTLW